jgi:Spo0E like sporulation regulatory protein
VKKAESYKIIPQSEDNIEFEQKRKQLIHSAMTKGLTNPQTLKISEELDAAILSIMKKQHFSRFPNV